MQLNINLHLVKLSYSDVFTLWIVSAKCLPCEMHLGRCAYPHVIDFPRVAVTIFYLFTIIHTLTSDFRFILLVLCWTHFTAFKTT